MLPLNVFFTKIQVSDHNVKNFALTYFLRYISIFILFLMPLVQSLDVKNDIRMSCVLITLTHLEKGS